MCHIQPTFDLILPLIRTRISEELRIYLEFLCIVCVRYCSAVATCMMLSHWLWKLHSTTQSMHIVFSW